MKMTHMRILMLNYEFPPLGGGGGVASYKLAKGFVDRGYHVDYITTWFSGLKKYEVVDGIHIHRVKVIGRKELTVATMFSMISFPFLAYRKAIKLCKTKNYDFINTQFVIPTGPLGVWLSKKFKIKNILSIHGGDIYDPSKKNSPHEKWYFRKVINWVMNNSDFIVAQSSNTKKNAIKYYNPDRDIQIIPLPYEPFSFEKISRNDLGMNDDIFYVISTGRLVKRKGFDFLLKSLAKVNKVHALIIGDGPEKNNLQELAISLGLLDRVHFLGFVTEEKKFQYLSQSDVYILSSVHEGFGIVLQEAMQIGLPIISTDNGGQIDLINENENGYLIQFGDDIALAEKIELVQKNNEIRRNFSDCNKEKINDFRTEKICNMYLRLILS